MYCLWVNVYCTVLYCTVLYCTVLYCTVLYCTVLYCTVLLPPGDIPTAVNKYIISLSWKSANAKACGLNPEDTVLSHWRLGGHGIVSQNISDDGQRKFYILLRYWGKNWLSGVWVVIKRLCLLACIHSLLTLISTHKYTSQAKYATETLKVVAT